jgi:beta-ribofuranosylaminobenzene 5'-phosphate synthase
MGFLDPAGSLGRQFGGIGVALNEIATRLTIRVAERLGADGPQAERAIQAVRALSHTMHVPEQVHVQIDEAIPDHVGLGSGTQLALAIGAGLDRLYDLDLDVRDIAGLTDRGARSGIGIGVFEQGGFVVDGGRSERTRTPPVIARFAVPEQWRFILVFDDKGQGIHGAQERDAFKALPPFPTQESARFCHLMLMQALPALAESDIEAFGDVITQLQSSVGDYFAAAQGGRFSSRDVGEAVEWLGRRGAVALGQSSWGPTGFCAVDGIEQAEHLFASARQQFGDRSALSFKLASGRNQGGRVDAVKTTYDLAPHGSDRVLKRIGN